MSITIRPSMPDDAVAIADLLICAGLQPNIEPSALHWKYWMAREDWTGPRSFVAENGTQILAHAAIVPGACIGPTGRSIVLHLIDWAARADSSGLGSSLMKHIGRLADGLLAIGGSDQTLQILPHIGYKPCGAAEGYVRVLNPLRYPVHFTREAWKTPAKFARRSLWRLTSPIAAPTGWNVRRLESGDVESLQDLLPTNRTDMTVLERSGGMFRHVLRCPIASMELHALERKHALVGYFILAFVPGQARLADCWTTTEDPAAWSALLQHAALRAAKHPDVAEIVAWSSDAIMTRALSAGGFHRRNRQPIMLRSNPQSSGVAGPLRVQMIDSDAAYLHSRIDQPWA